MRYPGGIRARLRRYRVKVDSDQELAKIRKASECEQVRMGELTAGGGVRQEHMMALPEDKFQKARSEWYVEIKMEEEIE